MRRSSKPLPKDPNQRAAEIVRLSTEGEPPEKETSSEPLTISEYLSQIGRKGGLKGGKARARKLSRKQRQAIARKAAITRWQKQNKEG